MSENFNFSWVTTIFPEPFTHFCEHHIAPAFEELREHGFHASTGNIQCCQTCSLAVIPDNVSYVFYHAQDIDGFNEKNTLFLGFGFSNDHDRDVCLQILRKHMPRVEWNGSETRRIQVFGEPRNVPRDVASEN